MAPHTRYEQRDRVVVGEDADTVRRRLVADWWAASDPDRSVMIAHRRVDVADLNGRALMRASGVLGDVELPLDGGAFAAGDRVVLRRNDRTMGVVNGDRGTVVAVDPAARTLDVELAGRRVRLDAGYLGSTARHGPARQHAYAITGHVAQGLTFRQTFVLATDQISREWGYSALSRGREANRLYAIAAGDDERDEYAPAGQRSQRPRERLTTALGRSAAHTLASNVGREQRLIGALQRAVAEREAAASDHASAVCARAELERTVPHRLRRRSLQGRRRQLAQARATEAAALGRLDGWRDRETTLRGQLAQERAAEHAPHLAVEVGRESRSQRMGRRSLERPEHILDGAIDSARGLER